MKFVTILTVLLVALAGTAMGDPIDPDPNGIGIFFDEGAGDGSWCVDAAVGSQETAYLCLTRTTDQSGFTAPQVPTEDYHWGTVKALYRD